MINEYKSLEQEDQDLLRLPSNFVIIAHRLSAPGSDRTVNSQPALAYPPGIGRREAMDGVILKKNPLTTPWMSYLSRSLSWSSLPSGIRWYFPGSTLQASSWTCLSHLRPTWVFPVQSVYFLSLIDFSVSTKEVQTYYQRSGHIHVCKIVLTNCHHFDTFKAIWCRLDPYHSARHPLDIRAFAK